MGPGFATKPGGPGSVLTGTHFDLGREQIDGENFSGILDEARLSNVARSADWIATEYNNQSSPATFYALGGEDGSAPVSVSVSPSAAVLRDGQTQQFTATVTNIGNTQQ